MRKQGKLIAAMSMSAFLLVGMNSVFADGNKYAWYAPAPHPYFEEMKKGVVGFEKEYGVEVNMVVGSSWTQGPEDQDVRALAADGYNLFSIFPCDPSGANGLYEEIVARGAFVNNFGATTTWPTPAGFYSGTDIPACAGQAAEALAKLINFKGNVILAVGALGDLNAQKCSVAARSVFAKYNGIKILQEVSDMSSVEVAQEKMESAISSNIKVLDGILMTDYTPTDAAATVLAEYYEKNPKAKHIFVIGRDDTEKVLNAIRSGIIDGTSAQNAYGMGYLPMVLLKYQSEGWVRKNDKAYNVFSGHMIVTKKNVDTYKAELVALVKDIKSKLETDYLVKK
jgi:ribose transport system substrate-binding protein